MKAMLLISALLFGTCCLEVRSLLIKLDFFNLSASRAPASLSFMWIYENINTISFSQQAAAPASLALLFLSVIDRCLIQTNDPSDIMIVKHDDDDSR